MILRHLVLTMLLMTFATGAAADCNSSLRTDTPAERFTVLHDVFVVDESTGLMWQRCPLGYAWQNSSCHRSSAAADGLTWQEALQNAATSEEGDYQDWRLPNMKELETIVDRSCWEPAISLMLFPGSPTSLFWTSSPNAVRQDVSAVVDFAKGAHRSLNKLETASVRLVRDYAAPRAK